MTDKMKSDQNNPKKPKRNSGNFWRNAALIGTLALPLFFSSPKASAQETNASEKQGKNYIYSHDKKIAEIKNLDLKKIEKQIEENYYKLFENPQ